MTRRGLEIVRELLAGARIDGADSLLLRLPRAECGSREEGILQVLDECRRAGIETADRSVSLFGDSRKARAVRLDERYAEHDEVGFYVFLREPAGKPKCVVLRCITRDPGRADERLFRSLAGYLPGVRKSVQRVIVPVSGEDGVGQLAIERQIVGARTLRGRTSVLIRWCWRYADCPPRQFESWVPA